MNRRTFMIGAGALLTGCGGGGGTGDVVMPSAVQRLRVVECYGESTFTGYGLPTGTGVVDRLRGMLADCSVVNRAVNSTTAQQLYEGRDGLNLPWRQQMAQSKADIVVLNRGINDAYQGISADDFRLTMLALVEGALQAGKTVILQTPNAVSNLELSAGVARHASTMRDIAAVFRLKLSDAHAMQGSTVDGTHPDTALAHAMAADLANIIRGTT